MESLYEATDGPNWTNTWDLKEPINTWYGVSTNENGCVSAVNLSSNNLIGLVPFEIRNLYNIDSLVLSDNQLKGTIPSSIGNLKNLVSLQLNHNQLSGTIPDDIGLLKSLQFLDLHHNQLNGELPSTIGQLEALITLELSQNELTGSIPDLFERLTSLRKIHLNNNELSGILPQSLFSLRKLEWLYLNNNQLSGSIKNIHLFGNAVRLYLNNNQFTGSIPIGLSGLLEELHLNDNQLSGDLPFTLGISYALRQLHLENNQLSGCYWPDFRRFCNLDYNFSGNPDLPDGGILTNFCEGKIETCADCPLRDSMALAALYNATNGQNWTTPWDLNQPYYTWKGVETHLYGCVTGIRLGNNNLIGSIPPEIGQLKHLLNLDLSSNQLTGPIPREIGDLTNLYRLVLNNNRLSETIPPTIGNLINLHSLYLHQNKLSGNMPPELGKLLNLDQLYLSDNELTGTIPETFGNLINIQLLLLGRNALRGSIPASLGNLSSVRSLELSNNQLTGRIPSELGKLKKLVNIILDNNQLSGSIPIALFNHKELQGIYLQHNQLTGTIPTAIGELKNLRTLNLSHNKISGVVPAEINQLRNLSIIRLNDNQLIGNLPEWLGNLSELSYLYLNNNQLTGPIPSSIGYLKQLSILNLGYNELEGCLPESLENLCSIFNLFLYGNWDLPNQGAMQSFCTDRTGMCCDPVWPGDFNNDGIVSKEDILYWGLTCRAAPGPTRPNASTKWVGQEAPNWATAIKNINAKHQDGDGNGLINEADLQVLVKNYGKVHGYQSFDNSTDGITYDLVPNNIGGDTLEIALELASNGESIDLHGIACSIDFGSLPIDTLNFDITNSSLNPDQQLILFNKEDNILDIALTRTDKTDTLCSGEMGSLWVVIADIMDFGDDIIISAKDGSQIRVNGELEAVGNATLYSTYSLPASSTNLLLNVSVTPVECNQLGTAKLNISGGVGPYNIQWSNGASTPTITGLKEGIYSVIVTDDNGTSATYEAEVEGLYAPKYDKNGQLINCSTNQEQAVTTNINASIASKKPHVIVQPNPLKQEAIITYELPIASKVSLSIFTMQGTKVRLLENAVPKIAGAHQINFSAANLSQGIYLVYLQTADSIIFEKMMILD